MSYFKAKIHLIRFQQTPLGSSPDSQAGFKGPTSKGKGGWKVKKKGKV